MKKRKPLTATVNDDDLCVLTADLAQCFPKEHLAALALFSATLMAQIFDDAQESEEPERVVRKRACENYTIGDHDFFIHSGGSLGEQYQVEHYHGDTLLEKRIKPDMHEAFKFVLTSLADYL